MTPRRQPFEWRVQWRRAHWASGSMSTRHYQRKSAAEDFARTLCQSGEFETVTIDRREVGPWTPHPNQDQENR